MFSSNIFWFCQSDFVSWHHISGHNLDFANFASHIEKCSSTAIWMAFVPYAVYYDCLFAGPAWCEHWEWSVQPAGFLYAIDSSRNHPSSTFNQCKGAFTLGSIAWSEPKFDCCPLPLPLLDCVHIILFGSELVVRLPCCLVRRCRRRRQNA